IRRGSNENPTLAAAILWRPRYARICGGVNQTALNTRGEFGSIRRGRDAGPVLTAGVRYPDPHPTTRKHGLASVLGNSPAEHTAAGDAHDVAEAWSSGKGDGHQRIIRQEI